MIESRSRWEPKEPRPPEGWRFCFGQFDENNDKYYSLWTDAPNGKNPHARPYQTKWIEHERIRQEREVGEWRDV